MNSRITLTIKRDGSMKVLTRLMLKWINVFIVRKSRLGGRLKGLLGRDEYSERKIPLSLRLLRTHDAEILCSMSWN